MNNMNPIKIVRKWFDDKKLKTGVITEKGEVEPVRNSFCAPYLRSNNLDYVLVIKGKNAKGKEKTRIVFVIKAYYSSVNIGQTITVQ